MTTGELIKILADYCPDTKVEALDGNLLVTNINTAIYGESALHFELINDGEGGHPDTLYLVTD